MTQISLKELGDAEGDEAERLFADLLAEGADKEILVHGGEAGNDQVAELAGPSTVCTICQPVSRGPARVELV